MPTDRLRLEGRLIRLERLETRLLLPAIFVLYYKLAFFGANLFYITRLARRAARSRAQAPI